MSHVHFCPRCNYYKSCEDDCDPIDWDKEEREYTYPSWLCDDCLEFVEKMASGYFEKGAGI